MAKNNKKNVKKLNNEVKIPNWLFIFIALFLSALFLRAGELALKKEIDGINLNEFASNRTTKKETIRAKRATIYDCKGEALAQNIYS